MIVIYTLTHAKGSMPPFAMHPLRTGRRGSDTRLHLAAQLHL